MPLLGFGRFGALSRHRAAQLAHQDEGPLAHARHQGGAARPPSPPNIAAVEILPWSRSPAHARQSFPPAPPSAFTKDFT